MKKAFVCSLLLTILAFGFVNLTAGTGRGFDCEAHCAQVRYNCEQQFPTANCQLIYLSCLSRCNPT